MFAPVKKTWIKQGWNNLCGSGKRLKEYEYKALLENLHSELEYQSSFHKNSLMWIKLYSNRIKTWKYAGGVVKWVKYVL